MKKTLLLFSFFFSCACFAQENSEKVVKRIENKLYVVENGIKYDVDETRIIAKLKPHRELPNHLRGNIMYHGDSPHVSTIFPASQLV